MSAMPIFTRWAFSQSLELTADLLNAGTNPIKYMSYTT